MGGDIVYTRSRIYLIEVLDLKYEMISNSIFEEKKDDPERTWIQNSCFYKTLNFGYIVLR